MQKAAIQFFLLVLGWSQTLEGLPVLPNPVYPTESNFDLGQFLGTWHDVAKASSSPCYQRHTQDAAIGKLVLQSGDVEGKLKMTRTLLKKGICKERIGDYELTGTPGRFFYHVAKWGADVDKYVYKTNYKDYALVISIKMRSSGTNSTSAKLYSRTRTVTPAVMDDFKTLVAFLGIREANITIKQDKGDCVPDPVVELTDQPQTQRMKRSLLLPLPVDDVEGSGDEGSLFNSTSACSSAPDTGPCFGMHDRYFYNSSSMSCELFKFGGCLGNQNNFITERECLQRCRTEAVCSLPMSSQPCTGQPAIWAYDSSVGLCVPYKQGFCQTNGNKFYTKAECEEYCSMVKDDGLLLSN